MPTPRLLLAATAALSLLATGACASDSDSSTGVAITASDTECQVAETDLAAGKISFEIKNEGKQVTEVYVYAPGDKVVTERENIGPGTSATMNVDLAAGDYEIACKPGQTGDGIRTAIEVSGDGGKAVETTYDREVEFTGTEYSFAGLDDFTATAGEKIEFKMSNVGAEEHEFEVFGPDGKVLGEIGPTKPGAEGEVILALTEAGTYRFICDIEDHASKGMVGTFQVKAA